MSRVSAYDFGVYGNPTSLFFEENVILASMLICCCYMCPLYPTIKVGEKKTFMPMAMSSCNS